MGETYDDDRPTHRWVRIGYAKTADGRIDKARVGKPELLDAAEAKRIVDNNHGRYLSEAEVAEMDAERAEVAEAVKPAPDAPQGVTGSGTDGPPITPPEVPAPSGKPANLRAQGWGASTEKKES